MKQYSVSVIGNRAYPHSFVGTSGIEVYCESILKFFPKRSKITVYVKSVYQALNTDKAGQDNIRIKQIQTFKSKVFESIIYGFLASILTMFDGSTVVWYHGVGQALFSFLPRFCGKKIVLTVHGEDWKRKKWSRIQKLLFKSLASFVFFIPPHKIFVVSKNLQKTILLEFGAFSTVAYPGIFFFDTKNKVKMTDPPSILKKINLRKDAYILYIGRIVPEKRLELLIISFQKLVKKYPQYNLVIAGGHGNTQEYNNTLIQSIKTKKIIFSGYIFGKDKIDLISNSKVLVLPSEIEGNPISVLEALSLNKQVLIANQCLDDSFKGLQGIHTFSDQDSFYLNLEKVMKNDSIRVTLPEFINKSYSWKKSALLYLRAIIR